MKTSRPAALLAVLLAMSALVLCPNSALAVPGNGNGNGNGNNKLPLLPTGTLDAYPTLVQTGTHPTLTWEIEYPENIVDIVVCPGPITPIEDLCMDIRILGAPHRVGYDNKGRPVYGYVQAAVRVGETNPWTLFFYDVHDAVKPSQVYYSGPVQAGQRIDFRARCYENGAWTPMQGTDGDTSNLAVLINGDPLPDYARDGEIKSFLQPYIDAGGNVSIGPKDVLYLFELNESDPSSVRYDMQDLALLVTFDYCKNNNGHGNNVDGVDVSNPGRGSGGPNGEDDPSGTVDDEIIK